MNSAIKKTKLHWIYLCSLTQNQSPLNKKEKKLGDHSHPFRYQYSSHTIATLLPSSPCSLLPPYGHLITFMKRCGYARYTGNSLIAVHVKKYQRLIYRDLQWSVIAFVVLFVRVGRRENGKHTWVLFCFCFCLLFSFLTLNQLAPPPIILLEQKESYHKLNKKSF